MSEDATEICEHGFEICDKCAEIQIDEGNRHYYAEQKLKERIKELERQIEELTKPIPDLFESMRLEQTSFPALRHIA